MTTEPTKKRSVRSEEFRTGYSSKTFALLGLVGLAATLASRALVLPAGAATPTRQAALTAFGKLPLSFEPNVGQTDSRVQFTTRTGNGRFFLTGDEAVLSLQRPGEASSRKQGQHPQEEAAELRMRLLGASSHGKVEGTDRLPGTANYFLGNDHSKWHAAVPTYARARQRNVYPGIDEVYYGNQGGQLENDFLVRPGANPDRIHISYGGTKSARIDSNGDLVLETPAGAVREKKPVAYQGVSGKRVEVSCSYSLDSSRSAAGHSGSRAIRFRLAAYDRTRPLVIDPVLSYSTYYGGSSLTLGQGIALDPSGNIYVTGYTDASDIPTSHPYQSSLREGRAGYVLELAANGQNLIYATYLGGTNGSDYSGDYCLGIAVDSSGKAYVTGGAGSSDFPTVNAYQSTNKSYPGGNNAFVTELAAGGQSLVFSTFLGGSILDQAETITVDSSDNAYVGGLTYSNDFPTHLAYQSTNKGSSNGQFNAFVTEFAAGGQNLVFSTYLGGGGQNGYGDSANVIAIDASKNVYVTGFTCSTDFPTHNAYQATIHGGSNAFVTKFAAGGQSLVYSTYLGGSYSENGLGLAVDSAGNAYVTGNTYSSDFPTTSGAFQTTNYSSYPGTNEFVTKFTSTGNLGYSTLLGGHGSETPFGAIVNSLGQVFVTGISYSSDYPTTSGAYQTTNNAYYNGQENAVLTKVAADGKSLLYSTYLGGSATTRGYGIASDSAGNVYLTGYTSATDYPTVNPFQSSNHNTSGDSGNVIIAKFNLGTGPTIVLSGQSAGPPATATISVQDTGSGLQSISVLASSNCAYFSPNFTVGTNSPVSMTFDKNNQSQKATFTVEATDLAGNTFTFDPVIAELEVAKGKTSISRSFGGIQQSEHVLTVQNETPGLNSIQVTVNGEHAGTYALTGGATASIDLTHWLHSGSRNQVTLTGAGKPGAAASVVIAPNALPGASARSANGQAAEWSD